MKESTRAKSQRILDVMLTGKKITPADANRIADTTDGTRYIRYLREKYPIKDEKVKGEMYHRYWIDDDFLYDWWKSAVTINGVAVNTTLAV